ncbi:hypothetical protein PHLGIDRAFT_407088 [Phlebiopsis gigantea 11061_1 CR5-6]|uniref:Uncharacterized protein n=1 Tax=Phlebiopsis gigantea (strain 11061_1 CR5-6) TaxID=745531 RepID=A0A0C3S8Z0_PHLG1|nr:hypothetical protein PHLGIDRAFT_407088 [Phlebiopsis gigantea 11061_1 CR5-6]
MFPYRHPSRDVIRTYTPVQTLHGAGISLGRVPDELVFLFDSAAVIFPSIMTKVTYVIQPLEFGERFERRKNAIRKQGHMTLQDAVNDVRSFVSTFIENVGQYHSGANDDTLKFGPGGIKLQDIWLMAFVQQGMHVEPILAYHVSIS